MCSIFAHTNIIFTAEKLQTCEIYIVYALKHIVFGILVKKHFVTLQLLHKHALINVFNLSTYGKKEKRTKRRTINRRKDLGCRY